MAPTKNRMSPTEAATPIRGRPIPTSIPIAPAALRRPSEKTHQCGTPSLVMTATEVRGAQAVAKETLTNSRLARFAQPALVNGALGIVVCARGQLDLALTLTIRDGKITEIDVIADPVRLRQLDLAVLDS
jgi:hypothetical protein